MAFGSTIPGRTPVLPLAVSILSEFLRRRSERRHIRVCNLRQGRSSRGLRLSAASSVHFSSPSISRQNEKKSEWKNTNYLRRILIYRRPIFRTGGRARIRNRKVQKLEKTSHSAGAPAVRGASSSDENSAGREPTEPRNNKKNEA